MNVHFCNSIQERGELIEQRVSGCLDLCLRVPGPAPADWGSLAPAARPF